jgi:hypothetical protein
MSNFLQCTWSYIKEGIFGTGVNDRGLANLSEATNCPRVFSILDSWQPFFKDVFVILVTLGVFAAITAGYFALKPTVMVEQKLGHNQCPDQWVYRAEDGMCHPLYQTTCTPFNPEVQRGNQCDIAKRCMTTWKGLCD